ncbi:helix-turn-helix transcriptional regulator [Pararhizobium antarcticum]|uniref:DNA-binding protein n=1 Tax=Pararhizobium antarcticum TaxID=1798805 RepID=A0A657LQV1_9HYPH|nr:PAS domain-containing protein [Pararhizobium antarcticum]OJF94956.1 hypothetical protein AX760_03740 [Pararhizobium antarcticum]OJF97458.1 hypothetical protein AX761_14640 [Rhizobium sp. 58]
MSARLKAFIPVCDAVAALLAPHAEAVLHDLSTGLIFHIANAYSRRRSGDSSLNDAVATLEGDVIGPYGKRNWDGRRLKSVTAVLRDDTGAAFGLLCINHDIDALSGLVDQLTAMIDLPQRISATEPLMAGDWRERVNSAIGTVLSTRNTTLAGMTTADMDALIAGLDAQGIFGIRKAVPYVAEILKLSRATIYNRLSSVRQQAKSNGEPLK